MPKIECNELMKYKTEIMKWQFTWSYQKIMCMKPGSITNWTHSELHHICKVYTIHDRGLTLLQSDQRPTSGDADRHVNIFPHAYWHELNMTHLRCQSCKPTIHAIALKFISRMPMVNGATNWNQLYEHHMDWHDHHWVWTSPTSRPNSSWAEFWREFCQDHVGHQIVESSLAQSPSPATRAHGHHTTHTTLW